MRLATRTDAFWQSTLVETNRTISRAKQLGIDFTPSFEDYALVPDNWSREEVEAAVADYFDMLAKELRGEPFNKAEHNRVLQRMLDKRSRGSVERKHQNISAILIEAGFPYIDGYKPLGNYQELLQSVVRERLAGAATL